MGTYTYVAFRVVDCLSHLIVDFVECILAGSLIRTAVRTGKRKYLDWLMPAATACGLSLIYRIGITIQLFSRHRPSVAGIAIDALWLDIADIAAVYAAIVLLGLMKCGRLETGEPPDTALQDVDAWPSRRTDGGTWPPPPRRGQ